MTEISKQLPLTIISGYLGSGKTTLVNHLLRNANGRQIMVLVNDFGELPIDADLILNQEGNTINLANGCACCSMGGDLFNALVDALNMNPRPDHLLIEASGVADPARIANIALAEPDLELDATVSLVDAETFADLIDDKLVGETVAHQLISSDIILTNKLDLVDEDARLRLAKKLTQIAPNADIIETEYSKVPVELVIGIKLHDNSKPIHQLATEAHGSMYSKWARSFETPLDKIELENALKKCADMILRLKGIVYLDGFDTPHVVQCVRNRCTITPVETANSTQSRLVAIGLIGKLDLAKLDSIFSLVSK